MSRILLIGPLPAQAQRIQDRVPEARIDSVTTNDASWKTKAAAPGYRAIIVWTKFCRHAAGYVKHPNLHLLPTSGISSTAMAVRRCLRG